MALFLLARSIPHPNPEPGDFYVTLGLYSAWSLGALVWVSRRRYDPRFALVATALDVIFITVLAGLSGGPFSNARLAYFLIPVSVAFRFRPAITAFAAAATVGAYVIQALAHTASSGR